jgi:hypothetical protein
MAKDFVRQSIITNVGNFVKNISNLELYDLVNFVCYVPNIAPTQNIENETQRKFVDEILGTNDWELYINDLIKKPYFLSSSGSFRSNLDLIEKILHSEVFFRFQETIKSKVVEKPLFTKGEKQTLTDILDEHKVMLEYQLEDEKSIIESCGDDSEELIKLKKKHLKFIKKFA